MTRLVGRAAELDRLGELLHEDRPVVVVGEAGIGKSTLLRVAAMAAGRVAVEIGGLSTLAERPYGALRRLLDGPIDGDAAYLATVIERRVGPEVLIVDDIQWLDAATRSVVRLLFGRVAVLAAVRTGTAATDDALAFAVGAGSARLDLQPLDLEAGIALARAVRPDLSAVEATRVATRAGGNPFFLLELATSGAPTAGSDVVIRLRLAELEPTALESARRLAVLGRPASPGELGEGESDLVRSGIAVLDRGAIAFQHQLLAEHVLASLSADELAATRLELAQITADPLEAARLSLAAGDLDGAARAAAIAEAVAPTTGDRIEALRLRAAAATGDDARLLRVAAAAQLIEIHDYAAAAALLDGLDAWDAASIVRLDAMRGRIAAVVGRIDDARELLARAVPAARDLVSRGDPDGTPLLIDALASDAQIRAWGGDPNGGLALAEESVQLADGVHDAATRARTLLGYLLITCDRPADALEPLRAAVASRQAGGDGPGELQALNVLLLAEMSISGSREALVTCRHLDERAAELHLFVNREAYRPYLVFLLDAAGRYREALEVAEEMAESLSARAAIYGPGYAALVLARVGRFDAARAMLSRLEERRRDDPEAERLYLDTAGTIELAQGRAGHALQAYEACASVPQKSESDALEPALNAMWARWDLGRDPGPPIDPGTTPRVAGVGPESLGLVHLHGGRHAEAVRSFDDGAAAWTPFLAWNADRCRWAAGEALRVAGRVDEAIERLLAAEQVALGRDARPQVARVQRSLRLLGVRRAAPRAPSGSDLLTGRERELMNLVAAGHNNVEIGRRLGLGRGTVHRLLSSAMGKLGAETRSHAVALLEAV